MSGERTEAGWVNENDFETELLDGDGNPLGKVGPKLQPKLKD
jgi:hypothetical protein